MGARRRIALITTELENIYQQRVMKGMFAQCAKYGYDVAVISTFLDTSSYREENMKGELNIFNLINFDLFDGVIITPTPLFAMDDGTFEGAMLEYFQSNCHCKVVALDLPFGDYEVVYTDDTGAFYEIAKHIFEIHHKKKVYFLTGHRNYGISEQRLAGFLNYAKEHDISVPDDHIFYGDFWYTSGEKLADDISSGAVEMPDAVICASDHMAIGLVNRLRARGISVPGQIAVTGYDATQEATFNDTVICSYEPKVGETAARGVNRIHSVIAPGASCFDFGMDDAGGLRPGESCGCPLDMVYWKKCVDSALLKQKAEWAGDEDRPSDISRLLGSYMLENLTSASDYMMCMDRIYGTTYLLHPYGDFWLCMRENWLDLNEVVTFGYPDRMRIFIHSQGANDTEPAKSIGFCDEQGQRSFDRRQMLPEMHEEREEASVFYFLPVHAEALMYGYVAVRCPLVQKHILGYLFHHWIRFISNALTMTRIRNRLFELSMKDAATGLYNRRGMAEWLACRLRDGCGVLVVMADMDGLKRINDQFGHADGDFSLHEIAKALEEAAEWDEICARIGGDEFLLVGVGHYTQEDILRKMGQIQENIDRKSRTSGKEYEISASLGYAVGRSDTGIDIDRLIEEVDAAMYVNKREKKKNRG